MVARNKWKQVPRTKYTANNLLYIVLIRQMVSFIFFFLPWLLNKVYILGEQATHTTKTGKISQADFERFKSIIGQQKAEIQRLQLEIEKKAEIIAELRRSITWSTTPESLIKGIVHVFLLPIKILLTIIINLFRVASDAGFS